MSVNTISTKLETMGFPKNRSWELRSFTELNRRSKAAVHFYFALGTVSKFQGFANPLISLGMWAVVRAPYCLMTFTNSIRVF